VPSSFSPPGWTTVTFDQPSRPKHPSALLKPLERAIRALLDVHNEKPKPFVWTKTADEILASIARFTNDEYIVFLNLNPRFGVFEIAYGPHGMYGVHNNVIESPSHSSVAEVFRGQTREAVVAAIRAAAARNNDVRY